MADTTTAKSYGGLRVLVAGGGVAGIETVLALRALAGDMVDLELLAPDPRFWYRPLAVAEPFAAGRAGSLELAAIAEAVGADFTLDRLRSVDDELRIARTDHAAELAYDALVIACGAVPRPALPGALTFRGPADSDAFRRLLDEVQLRQDVHSLAFVVPSSAPWPLPAYELALQTAAYLDERDRHVELAVVTPEPAPLAQFGESATEVVWTLLTERAISFHGGRHAIRYENGRLELAPHATLMADRVVALPRLEAPRILGVPQDEDGFIATNLSGRIHGMTHAYAAGDVTQFAIKQGGIASQQADAVAEVLAAQAGAPVHPHRFEPVLRGLLLTGEGPRYLRARLHGGHGDTSTASPDPLWWPPAKIAGRHLAPFLASLAAGGSAAGTTPALE
jgi:sulfide:quinone oxidoreductase